MTAASCPKKQRRRRKTVTVSLAAAKETVAVAAVLSGLGGIFTLKEHRMLFLEEKMCLIYS